MGAIVTNDEHYYHIASAIRERLAVDTLYRPSDMPSAIMSISSIGTNRTIIPYAVRMNGLYEAPSSIAYDPVTVSVDDHINLVNTTILSNGTYYPSEKTAFKNVTVEIPGETITILPFIASSNQIYYAPAGYLYNPVTVSVPLYSLSSHTFYSDGTFDAPSGYLYGPITIDAKGNADNTSIYSLVRHAVSFFSESRVNKLRPYAFFCNSGSRQQWVSMPELVEIGSHAFHSCGGSGFSSVSHSKCELIGEYAFCYCRSLHTVSFPACTSIGSNAFYECSRLQKVSLPECRYIGVEAFRDCSVLSSVNISKCEVVEEGAFIGVSTLSSLSLPKCTTIGSYAFSRCTSLVLSSLPKCVSIYTYAFRSCSKIVSLNLPVCKYIGPSAFYDCSGLRTISAPECTYVGVNALPTSSTYDSFYYAIFPKVSVVLDGNFANVAGLFSAYFAAATSVGAGAFRNCSKLTGLSFPNCSYIGGFAFASCFRYINNVSPTSASFPLCTYVGSNAFYNCTYLRTIYLPKCSFIGSSAFYGCSQLTSVYLMGSSVAAITGWTFQTSESNFKIYVPRSLYATYMRTSYWSTMWSKQLTSA